MTLSQDITTALDNFKIALIAKINSLISTHDNDSTAHADIRQRVTNLEEEMSEYYEDMAG